MRKTIIDPAPPAVAPDQRWLELDNVARVEVTSEKPEFPIDSAILSEGGSGWRADRPGEQIIRLLFDSPHRITQVFLEFVETEKARAQEFVLRWRPAHESVFRDIVRQQFFFSPEGATRETESYAVNLSNAAVLELRIVPDIGGGDAVAALRSLRLG